MRAADREQYERFKFEYQLVNKLFEQCEAHEREFLASLHCPTDPAGIYDVLDGRKPEPWPAKTSPRSRRLARRAMHTLVLITQARRHLRPDHREIANLTTAIAEGGLLPPLLAELKTRQETPVAITSRAGGRGRNTGQPREDSTSVMSPRPFLDHEQRVKVRKLAKARIGEADLNPRTKRQRQELYWFLLVSVGAALHVTLTKSEGDLAHARWTPRSRVLRTTARQYDILTPVKRSDSSSCDLNFVGMDHATRVSA